MQTVPLYLLSPFGNREHALELIRVATGLPQPAAHSLVLTLDAVAAAVLRSAGVPTAEALPILAALWQYPERLTDRPRRWPAAPAGDYRRGLGERIHVIRHARRLTPAGIRRQTGIDAFALQDLEAGVAWPTLPMLLRLAEVFQVPPAMLVDEKATPLRILRLLAITQTG